MTSPISSLCAIAHDAYLISSDSKFNQHTALQGKLLRLSLFKVLESHRQPQGNLIVSSSLYDTDYNHWIQDTIQQIQCRNFDRIDWENLIEELESMGKNDKRDS